MGCLRKQIPRIAGERFSRENVGRSSGPSAFTLVELLVVIAIYRHPHRVVVASGAIGPAKPRDGWGAPTI